MESINQAELKRASPPARGGRSWLRRGALACASLAAILLLAWFSFPSWAPWLANRFMPEGWALGEVEVRRPGLSATEVVTLEAKGTLGGMDVTLRGSGLKIRHLGMGLTLEDLDIEWRPGPDDSAPRDPLSLADFSIPRFLLPGSYPELRVDRLTVSGGDGPDPQRWQFEDLTLGSGESALRLDVTVDEPPLATRPLRVYVELQGATVEVRVMAGTGEDAGGDAAPLLRYSQGPAPTGSADAAMGLVEIDLPLDLLGPAELSPRLAGLGLGELRSLGGRVRGRLHFAGDDQLEPETLELTVDDAGLAFELGRIRGAITAEASRSGELVEARFSRLDLEGEIRSPAWRSALADRLRATGVETSFPDEPMILEAAIVSGNEHALTIQADPAGPETVTVDGGADLAWRQGDSGRLTAAVRDLKFNRADTGRSLSSTLEAQLEVDLELNHPVRLSTGDTKLGASALNLASQFTMGGAVPEDISFEGELAEAGFSGASVSNASFAVIAERLEFSGAYAWNPNDLRFAGPAEALGLAVAPADAVAGTHLLTARSLTADLRAEGNEVIDVGGTVTLAGAALPELGVRMDGVNVVLDDLALPAASGRITALTTGLEAALDESVYQGTDLDIAGTLVEGRRLDGEGELLLGYSASLPFVYGLDLDTAKLSLVLDQAVLPAAGLPAAARALAVTLPEKLRFTGGEIGLDGTLTAGADGLVGDLALRGSALALGLGESRLEGLDFGTTIAFSDGVSGDGSLALDLAQLAGGLDLRSLDTAIALRNVNDLGFFELRADLLGGQLRSPALRLVDGTLQDTVIDWSGFDLAGLLAFLDLDGLEGAGTMDARFPVVSVPAGAAVGLGIRDGSFEARGPGHLRYATEGAATNIGLQALENFQYERLSGTVDYASDGAYTITVDLLGKNPDLYGGHPIRFRLNLSGAMPALFRSLFVTGSFEEAIIERLRAGESPLEATEPQPPPGDDS